LPLMLLSVALALCAAAGTDAMASSIATAADGFHARPVRFPVVFKHIIFGVRLYV
jgi:hypothetical protein